MDTKGKISEKNIPMMLLILLIVAIVGSSAFIYFEYIREKPVAEAEMLDVYDEVNLYFNNPRAETAVTPASVLVKSGSTIFTPVAENGKATIEGVPKGTYSITAKHGSYYILDTTQVIEHTVAKPSWSYSMDEIGTFTWSDTAAAPAANSDENDQVITINIYLRNSADNTVIKDGKLSIAYYATGSENMTLDSLECTTHTFSKDDYANKEWEILIGNIEEQVTTTVTLRAQVDANGGGETYVLRCTFDDLRGTVESYSISAATKDITITGA